MSRALGAVAVGAAAAGTARAAYAGLRRRPPAGQPTWTRTNHRGELVTLLEGPAAAVGAVAAELAGAAVAARLADRRADQRRPAPGLSERSPGTRPARSMALAGGGALIFGVLDDLAGSGKRRGLRGHLSALAQGEVTTGTVKLAGLAATGFAAAVPGSGADVLINAGLIAGGANLLNLFDLRPGRAIKVAALSGALIAAGSAVTGGPAPRARGGYPGPGGGYPRGRAAGLEAVAAPLGAALALLPEDLGERAMLGDAGANALGAMLGAAAARSLPRPARAGLLAAIIVLTVASEKVSFTAVIERTPPLRRLDLLGRRSPGDNPAPSRRQRMGRHRRVGPGAGRDRSGARFLEFFSAQTPAHQES